MTPSLEVVDESYRELTQFFPSPGEVEHDPLEIAQLAISTLREVATRGPRGGSRDHRDRHHQPARNNGRLRPCDGRPFRPRHRLAGPPNGRSVSTRSSDEGYGPQVRATTGLVLDSYFSATKMRWMLDHGVADAARHPSFSTVDTWLLWTLTGGVDGGVFATEPSNASRTMLMDLATLDWSEPMMTLFGIERSMLAEIQPSASRFGTVSRNVIAELAGVPITGILGDQQSALFGQACFSPGLVKATYGTGAFVLANAGESVPNVVDGLVTTVAWDLGASGLATYALEGSAFVAGAAVQWLRDLGIIAASSELESLALSVPDSAGRAVRSRLHGARLAVLASRRARGDHGTEPRRWQRSDRTRHRRSARLPGARDD